MPWERIDKWLGAGNLFSTGQHAHVSVDYIRQRLTVTPEYDDTANALEREEFARQRKADN